MKNTNTESTSVDRNDKAIAAQMCPDVFKAWEGAEPPERVMALLRQSDTTPEDVKTLLQFFQAENVADVAEGRDEPVDWQAVYDATPKIWNEAEPLDGATRWNDAVMLGDPTDKAVALMERPAVFMLGELYGQGNRNNTQDGDWVRSELPWVRWLEGEGGKGAWGLTRHPVHKSKEGKSFVLADAIDGARTDSAIKTMYAVGIDIDSGAKLEDVVARLQELNVFAAVYTSHSHGKTELVLKHDDVMRKLKLDESPNRTQVQIYMREHLKDRYDESFIETIEIVEARKQTKDGLRIVLKTAPLDKFRVILPLAEPVELSELGASVNQWKTVWEDAVCGVAVNMLGVSFDATSCDVNRLFFTPRHKEGAPHYSVVIPGDPLRFEDIEPYSKDAYKKNRDPGDPFSSVGGDSKGGMDDRETYFTPDGMNLNIWHKTHKDRWEAADVMESFCTDKIRIAGGEKPGTCHIECPFEHEHSTEGGTATMVMNPDANSEHGYWTIFCRHDACAGRNKLEFLAEMLAQGWFDESLLTDEEWLIPLPNQDLPDEPARDEDGAELTLVQEAERFDHDTTAKTIRKLMKKALRKGADETEVARMTDALVASTVLGRQEVKNLWKDVRAEHGKKQREADNEDRATIPVANQWDFGDMVEWAEGRIRDANAKRPRLFHYIEARARIELNAEGLPRIRMLTKEQFAAELNLITKWHSVSYVGDTERRREVAAPQDVVSQLYGSTAMGLPYLRGIASTPFFAAGGRMVTEAGYDAGSGIFLVPSLDVPRVSKTPTDDEVTEAKRLLIEEVLADFPLGGSNRDEIVAKMLDPDPDGEGNSAGAHALANLLLMFCRDLVKGPTPGHLYTKPQPGTGASLLIDVENVIGYGEPTPAQALPTNREEMAKTLLTVISDGSSVVYFDNIDNSVNSGELASFMTAPRYKGRGLGSNQSIEAEVRTIAMFAGNNVRMSPELVRRLVMIDLNANSAQPEKRKGNGEGPDAKWRHPDIMAYVRENRGQLVWACLTLIQNWVANGMKGDSSVILNSYENWSRIMGGILRDAGIRGFLGNRDALKETATDDNDRNIHMLVAELASYEDGTDFKIGKSIGAIPAIIDIANGNNDINDNLPIRIKSTEYSRNASDPNPNKEDGDSDGDNRLYKSAAAFGKWFAREVVAMVNDKPRVWRVELWDRATQKHVLHDVRFHLGKDSDSGVALYNMKKVAV